MYKLEENYSQPTNQEQATDQAPAITGEKFTLEQCEHLISDKDVAYANEKAANDEKDFAILEKGKDYVIYVSHLGVSIPELKYVIKPYSFNYIEDGYEEPDHDGYALYTSEGELLCGLTGGSLSDVIQEHLAGIISDRAALKAEMERIEKMACEFIEFITADAEVNEDERGDEYDDEDDDE